VGPDAIEVPAGHYSAVHLTCTGTVATPAGKAQTRQDTWFVPGVGIARQQTSVSLAGRTISQVLLTLEKFEKP
jgi:hypothetical protein